MRKRWFASFALLAHSSISVHPLPSAPIAEQVVVNQFKSMVSSLPRSRIYKIEHKIIPKFDVTALIVEWATRCQ